MTERKKITGTRESRRTSFAVKKKIAAAEIEVAKKKGN